MIVWCRNMWLFPNVTCKTKNILESAGFYKPKLLFCPIKHDKDVIISMIKIKLNLLEIN